MTAKTISTYKGFDAKMQCRGHQFEVGKTYTHDGRIKICQSGFHACKHPLDVFGYYSPVSSRYAIVTQAGNIARHAEDSKIASSIITIERELSLHDLIQAAVEHTFSCAKKVKSTASATNGNYAHSATSGNGAHSATSGDVANSATSGNHAHSATSGNDAHSATSGNGANSATSGNGAHSATSGYGANSATSGNYAHSATSGDGAHSATSGNYAHSATSGNYAHSATSGDGANSATSGYGATAEASGAHGVAANAGNGPARAGDSGAIFLVERNERYEIVAVFASKVGENGIKPNTWYALKEGKPVEVTP